MEFHDLLGINDFLDYYSYKKIKIKLFKIQYFSQYFTFFENLK